MKTVLPSREVYRISQVAFLEAELIYPITLPKGLSLETRNAMRDWAKSLLSASQAYAQESADKYEMENA